MDWLALADKGMSQGSVPCGHIEIVTTEIGLQLAFFIYPLAGFSLRWQGQAGPGREGVPYRSGRDRHSSIAGGISLSYKRVGNGYLSIGSVYWLDPTHLIRCLVRLTYRLAWSSRPPIPQLLLVQLDIGVNPASPIWSNQAPIQLLSTIYPEPRGGTRRHRFGAVGLTGVYIGRSGTRVSSGEWLGLAFNECGDGMSASVSVSQSGRRYYFLINESIRQCRI